jgi:hypothetical protein
MAEHYSREQKTKLGELIAKGHRKFGKVMPRKPYLDDDEEGGGAGSAQLLFEQHPLLAQQPVGASSDLTAIISENRASLDEAEKRSDEAVPQLKKALEMKLGLGKQYKATPSPNPSTS